VEEEPHKGSGSAASLRERKEGAPSEAARKAEETADLIQRIELLFQLAHQDRGKAKDLKAELDRHGLFHDYEDRFLDLFRSGS
jgi:hypothetical protein